MAAPEMKRPRRGCSLVQGLSKTPPVQRKSLDVAEPTPLTPVAQMRPYAMPICLGERPSTFTSNSIIGGQLHPAADRLQRFCCTVVCQPRRLPSRWGRVMGRYRIGTNQDAPIIEVSGRQEWALKQLIEAGETGCTSVTNPGPRWSSYVHRLRRKGLILETV